jgi:hypothetical protein
LDHEAPLQVAENPSGSHPGPLAKPAPLTRPREVAKEAHETNFQTGEPAPTDGFAVFIPTTAARAAS